MVRVATADKTERDERGAEQRIQGQEIGISETTYHRLKKAIHKDYKAKKMDLDAEGKKVYLVHQQDRSVKAQPMDWFYGKSRPNLHIGVPAAEYDWGNKKNTYIERVVTGEEIGSLTGYYSTEKVRTLLYFRINTLKRQKRNGRKQMQSGEFQPKMQRVITEKQR
ncbi:MAG: hypothetical protein ACLR08_02565 [Dorea longicatena]